MRLVEATEDGSRLACLVGRPAVADRQERQHHALLVAKRDVLPDFEAVGEGLAHVERDRHRPERAVRKAHVVDHAVVVFLSEKALQGVEPAIHQQLEIADLPGRQVPGRQISGRRAKLLRAFPGNVELRDRGVGGHSAQLHESAISPPP